VKATALQNRTGRLIGSVSDSGEFLYGALISASVMAAVNTDGAHASFVALSALLVLCVYWLAHVYINAQAGLADQADSAVSNFVGRLRAAAGHEASVLKGGVPAVAVYGIALTFGMSSADAATTAVWLSVALLSAAGWTTARRAGLHGVAAVLDALAAAVLGLVVIAAKTLLH
jgi:hypothetical protein